ncbi:MAG: class I SAM-dependent methyltransferase [Gemmobacter sp.]|nr:class I SAM-dependent methyltransferase [Gemmobacter sp.]
MTSAPLCPLTGEQMRPWVNIIRDWRRKKPCMAPKGGWQLWWSEAGHYGQIYPRPSPTEVAEFYQLDSYYTHDDEAGALARPGFADWLRVGIAARLDSGVHPSAEYWVRRVPKGAVLGLDIGAGNGNLMLELAPLIERVVGIEPDAEARETARAKGLTVLPGTAEALPPEVTAERYDFIVIAHVLEHCLDPEMALRNAAELLKPGGILVVETPNNAALGLRQQGANWFWLDVPRHLNFFTEDSLRAFASRAGLKVTACEYWGYARQMLEGWLEAQAEIAACMDGRDAARPADLARQRRLAWRLMARTAWAPAAAKYDSVRLICQRT